MWAEIRCISDDIAHTSNRNVNRTSKSHKSNFRCTWFRLRTVKQCGDLTLSQPTWNKNTETQNVLLSASLLEISVCFILFVFSVTLYDSMRNVSHIRDSSKNLLCNFNRIFKFWTVISEWLKCVSDKLYSPSIATTDSSLLTLNAHKYKI